MPTRRLLVFALIAVGFMVALLAAHRVRRSMLVARALRDGSAAYDASNWAEAARRLGMYLSYVPDDRAALQRFARAQLRVEPLTQDRLKGAASACRSLLRSDPSDAEAFDRLAAIYRTLGDGNELEYLSRQRLSSAPGDAAARVALAEALVLLGKPADARRELELVVNDPAAAASAAGRLNEAFLILSALGDTGGPPSPAASQPAGLVWLDRAIARDANNAAAWAQRAWLRRMLAESASDDMRPELLRAARADLERAATLPTDDPRVGLVLGEEWTACGELDRARAALGNWRERDMEQVRSRFLDPDDWRAACYMQESRLHLLSGRARESAALADEMIPRFEVRRHRLRTLPAAVEAYVAAGRPADARRTLTEWSDLLKLADLSGAGQDQRTYLEGLVLRSEARLYAAIDALEPLCDQARKFVPWSAASLLATLYRQTGESSRADALLQRVVDPRRAAPQQLLELGHAQLRAGRTSAALQSARRAERISAGDAPRLLRIAAELTLAAQSETESALDAERLRGELEPIRERRPQDAPAWLLLADLLQLQGRAGDAARLLREAMSRCDDRLAPAEKLAALLLREQKADEALAVCQEACRPECSAAARLLWSRTLSAAGRAEEARNMLESAAADATLTARDRADLELAVIALDYAAGRRAQAIQRGMALAARDTADVRAHVLLLGLPEVQRDAAACEKLLRELRVVEGERGLWWRLRSAQAALASGAWRTKHEELAAALSYCISAAPGWNAPVLTLASLQDRLGRSGDAIQMLTAALRRDPSTPIADRLLDLLWRARRFVDAADVLERIGPQLDRRRLGLRRAAQALQGGDPNDAIRELQAAGAAEGDEAGVLVTLARLTYLHRQDAAAATALLDRAAAISPDLPTIALARTQVLDGEGRASEADAVLDELVRRAPGVEAYFLRAARHARQGRTDAAERDYRELARREPDGVGCLALGRFFAEQRRWDDAVRAFDDGLARSPADPALIESAVKALLLRGGADDRPRAARLLDEWERHSPDNPDALWLRICLVQTDPSPRAGDAIRTLVRRAGDAVGGSFEAVAGLARAALQCGDPQAAASLAARWLDSAPDTPEMILIRARARYDMNAMDDAESGARSALEIDPRRLDAYELLLEIAARRRDEAALREVVAGLRGIDPSDPQAERRALLAARALQHLGDLPQAIAEVESYRATAAGASSIAAALELQQLNQRAGRWDAADAILRDLERSGSDVPAVTKARLYWYAGQARFDELAALADSRRMPESQDYGLVLAAAQALAPSSAAAHAALAGRLFERCAALDALAAEPLHGLAELALRRGDTREAERHYRAALQRAPQDPDALNNLAWLLAERGDETTEPVELAQRAVASAPRNPAYRETLGAVLRGRSGRLRDARDEFMRAAELSPPDSAIKAKALLQAARTESALKNHENARGCATNALAIDSRRNVFADAERDELRRLAETR